jgi:uncharacterized protein YacL
MASWLIRLFLVVTSTMISYFQVSQTTRGLIIGLSVGLILVIVEIIIERIPLDTLVASGIGLVLGYIVGYLFEYGIFSLNNDRLSELAGKYSLLLKISFALLGLLIAVNKKKEVDLLDKDILKSGSARLTQQIKILDTSCIIDGRVADICETKFLTGPLILPQFVLNELHHLADSADSNKRVRARRGLDILKRLQEDPNMQVKIYDKDYPDIKEVDAKLVQLGKDLNGVVLTTDFNLNKIASLQGITVLNVNDLANSLKPIYLPGEILALYVVKEGKEREQGIGYLDDGTMIVVEEGRRFVGRKIDVVVTSMLQTSAGRLIFTRAK